MGEAILYCDKCGRIIPPTEVRAGTGTGGCLVSGDFCLCSACAGTLSPEERERLSGTVPSREAGPPVARRPGPRRAPPARRRSPATGVAIVGAGAGALVGVAAAALLAFSPAREGRPGADAPSGPEGAAPRSRSPRGAGTASPADPGSAGPGPPAGRGAVSASSAAAPGTRDAAPGGAESTASGRTPPGAPSTGLATPAAGPATVSSAPASSPASSPPSAPSPPTTPALPPSPPEDARPDRPAAPVRPERSAEEVWADFLVRFHEAGRKGAAEAKALVDERRAELGKLGLEAKLRPLERHVRGARLTRELAEEVLGTAGRRVRVRWLGRVCVGRSLGIEGGALRLEPPGRDAIRIPLGEVDPGDVADAIGLRRGATADPLKAAAYFLVRGEFDAARKELDDAAGEKAAALLEQADEIASALASLGEPEALGRGRPSAPGRPSVRAASSEALLVVGAPAGSQLDEAVTKRLEGLGFAVTVKRDRAASAADATGKALVLVSSTVDSLAFRARFREVAVPVVTWQAFLFDDLGLVGKRGLADLGWAGKQTKAVVALPSHPMAAGLAGTVEVTSSPGEYAWGRPNGSAAKVAVLADEPEKAVVFGYEKGAEMPGLAAPARRAGVFLGGRGAAAPPLNDSGWALFDAAVTWAAGRPPLGAAKALGELPGVWAEAETGEASGAAELLSSANASGGTFVAGLDDPARFLVVGAEVAEEWPAWRVYLRCSRAEAGEGALAVRIGPASAAKPGDPGVRPLPAALLRSTTDREKFGWASTPAGGLKPGRYRVFVAAAPSTGSAPPSRAGRGAAAGAGAGCAVDLVGLVPDGVWVEAERGGGRGFRLLSSADCSGGQRAVSMEGPGDTLHVDVQVPRDLPDAVVCVRYSRQHAGDGPADVYLGPTGAGDADAAGVTKLARAKMACTGSWYKYGWVAARTGKLARGARRVFVRCPVEGGAGSLDLIGIVPAGYAGRWTPHARVVDGKLAGGGFFIEGLADVATPHPPMAPAGAAPREADAPGPGAQPPSTPSSPSPPPAPSTPSAPSAPSTPAAPGAPPRPPRAGGAGGRENLLANGGFEKVGRDRFAEGWAGGQWGRRGAKYRVRVDRGEARSGERSLVVQVIDEGASAGARAALTLEAGRYEVSFWAMADVGKSAAVGARLAGEDAPGGTVRDEWTRLTHAVELTKRTRNAEVRLWSSTRGVRVWFDDAEVVRAD